MNPPGQPRLDRGPPDQNAIPCLVDAPAQLVPTSAATYLAWPLASLAAMADCVRPTALDRTTT
jgi:hypothetical protein